MARINVNSPEVQAIVEGLIMPLYLETSTVSGVTKTLNDAVASEGLSIQQNRIHAILSDEPTRGLNEQSLIVLRKAYERAGARTAEQRSADHGRLIQIGARVVAASAGAPIDNALIAERLSLPAAIVRLALAAVGERPQAQANATVHEAESEPDWGYQDQAVADCLDAFRRRPTGNIGLVLPTGGGKTRTAFRIIIERLAQANSRSSIAIWVTHRKSLHAQAARELDNLMENHSSILPAGAKELAKRVKFVMISEVAGLLNAEAVPELVVIDEAHHAAAPTYKPIFDAPHPFPVLLLTATPNRPDLMPIGIDEIAFTITYRELAERGAIITPEFESFDVASFTNFEEMIPDLVDRLIEDSADRFKKTLVLVTRREYMRTLYERLASAIDCENDHPLRSVDVGFIDGAANSLGLDSEDFLSVFAAKPRGIIISAQMLLEGYDDPRIDAVVITYKTESVIKLMQAAGRCVRYAPGKSRAWVVQANNPDLAYRFDQRWLYQEIDDRLLPELRDCDYCDKGELLRIGSDLLSAHRVDARSRADAMEALAATDLDFGPRLMFYGLPYFGPANEFEERATWGVFVETSQNSAVFRAIYNRFSQMGAEQSDPSEFLDVVGPRLGLATTDQRLRRQLIGVLTAAYFAREELIRAPGAAQGNRGYQANHSTTWLRYVTMRYRPTLPHALSAFLGDCHNRADVERAYASEPSGFKLAIKTALPFGGCEALLLRPAAADSLYDWIERMRGDLRLVEPSQQLTQYAHTLARLIPPQIPMAHLSRAERLLSERGRAQFTLELTMNAGVQ